MLGLPGGERGQCVSWKVRAWTDMWVTISCVVLCLSSSTMVSNGVDTIRSPCSALNVKVVRNSKQARVNDKRNHDSHEGSRVCSEC